MFEFIKHLLLPRYSNNQKAKLLHNQSLFLVALLLIGASLFIGNSLKQYPSVLGISIDISSQDMLLLTNEKRAEAGLPPLQLNSQLSQAAEAKAQDMFAKDYWAHFSPTGESPWDFIKAAGYSYVYAGENLARGFTTSNDVINAWMASPDHRANMLSVHYNDVGFATEQGRLPGDSNTVLVVEMFGSRYLAQVPQKAPPIVAPVAQVQVTITPSPSVTPTLSIAPVLAAVKNQPLLDTQLLTRGVSFVLLSLFLFVFGLDIVLTENRKTVRLAGHSFDHLLFLSGILIIAILLGFGMVH